MNYYSITNGLLWRYYGVTNGLLRRYYGVTIALLVCKEYNGAPACVCGTSPSVPERTNTHKTDNTKAG